MNKNKELNNKKSLVKEDSNKQSDEVSLDKVLDALGAEASTYKHAGMTHISSLLAEAS